MRPLFVLLTSLAVALAAPSAFALQTEGSAGAADCSGGLCDTINALCGGCIPAGGTPEDCMDPVCDAINRACERLFGASCVGWAAADCTGIPCDQINAACLIVFERRCLG